TVNPTSVGGTVNGSISKCSGTNSGTLTSAGRTGVVTDWQYSTDEGATWTTVSPTNATNSLAYSNLTQTTHYRTVVKNGVCDIAFSSAGIVTVNPIPDATASVPSQTICSGTTISTIEI